MTTTLSEHISVQTIQVLAEAVARDYATDLRNLLDMYEPEDLNKQIGYLNHKYRYVDPRVKIINKHQEHLDNLACL